MNLPFTKEQFLDVFKSYNLTVWPIQVLLVLLALIMILFLVKRNKYSDLTIAYGLSFYWVWIGIVYQLIFFTAINKAAYLFGTLFIIQGLIFFYSGIIKKELTFKYESKIKGFTALLFFLYTLIFYPLLGYQFGHIYPSSPTFGLPCPTTIFSFGILLLLQNKKKLLFIIPLLWAVIGFTAAIKLGIYEDTGLIIAGIMTAVIIFSGKKDG